MKKRSKDNKLYLNYLEKKYNFRKPYQVLVDVDFLADLNKYKHPMSSFKSILFCEPNLLISQCCYKAYKDRFEYENDFIRHCEIRRCKHEGLKTIDCILDLVRKSNKYHYFIATKEEALLSEWKETDNIPLITIFKNKIKFLNIAKYKKSDMPNSLQVEAIPDQ